MESAVRTLLLLGLAALALTGGVAGAAWWFEEGRRLRRILKKVLKRTPEAEAIDPGQGRAAGLDLDSGAVAVLWDRGGSGLVYAIDELEGAELIVDGQVAARAARGDRRPLDRLPADAGEVTLRLIFADARWPEFELALWGDGSVARAKPGETAGEAVKLGRRWLAHIDAVLRRPPASRPPVPRAEPDEPEV
ncbi:MAG TPA: hypothetical protein VEA15_09255 [Caulobacteraceae bacterium]|nr:hypothetical protein [Caulobacteraceae bacterium]